ncbi:hypothetical protein AAHA92_19039 [Salvia divinorum]|uniref:Uncharacterized protein n=1 Tax=Salvia divinorum TaxID=28513 RepID=A0ABD1H415_SALDI
MGLEEVVKFVMEKLKEALPPVENFGGEAIAWFDGVFQAALPWIIAAVALTVLFCLCRCCCGGGRRERMMRAPGRNITMRRSDFETNPQEYFRNLRKRP